MESWEAVGTGLLLITFGIDLLEPVFRIIFILSAMEKTRRTSSGRKGMTDHLESSTIDKFGRRKADNIGRESNGIELDWINFQPPIR